jgi:hypothetical protein
MSGKKGMVNLKTPPVIPIDKHQEIYNLYCVGISPPDIIAHLAAQNIQCSEKAIYRLIQTFRKEKTARINEIISKDAKNELDRLNWLQEELEGLAMDNRYADQPFFLKVADRLLKLYELKLNLSHSSMIGAKITVTHDHGREELLKELKQGVPIIVSPPKLAEHHEASSGAKLAEHHE